ncbi:unnamed protein product, partial [Cuscuta epithymum]
MSSPQNT